MLLGKLFASDSGTFIPYNIHKRKKLYNFAIQSVSSRDSPRFQISFQMLATRISDVIAVCDAKRTRFRGKNRHHQDPSRHRDDSWPKEKWWNEYDADDIENELWGPSLKGTSTMTLINELWEHSFERCKGRKKTLTFCKR